jgi:hypothetical protein
MAKPLESAQDSGALSSRQARSRKQAFRVEGSAGFVEAAEMLNNRLWQDVEMPRNLLEALTRGEKLTDLLEAVPGGGANDGTAREGLRGIRPHPGKRCPLTRNKCLFFAVEDIPAFGREMQAPEF